MTALPLHLRVSPDVGVVNKPTHILIIDGDSVFKRRMATYLTSRGYRVSTAVRVRDAINTAVAGRPDAVLLDHHLPGCNGLEVLKELKANEATREIPVLYFSSGRRFRARRRARRAGAEAVLAKDTLSERQFLGLIGGMRFELPLEAELFPGGVVGYADRPPDCEGCGKGRGRPFGATLLCWKCARGRFRRRSYWLSRPDPV